MGCFYGPCESIGHSESRHAYEHIFCLNVCWVICFQVASILAAYLGYTRLSDPGQPSPALLAYLHFTKEVRQVFQGIIVL